MEKKSISYLYNIDYYEFDDFWKGSYYSYEDITQYSRTKVFEIMNKNIRFKIGINRKTVTFLLVSISSSFLGLNSTYGKEYFKPTGNNTTRVTPKKRVGKSLKDSHAGNGFNLDISVLMQALYIIITNLQNSALGNKNIDLVTKINRIEQFLENCFIFTKNNVSLYIIGTIILKGGYKTLLSCLKKNKKEENEKASFKNTLIYNIALSSPEAAFNLLLINLFTEKRLNGLTKPIQTNSKLEKFLTYIKNHKILIVSITLLSILLFLIYIYRETIWEIYYSLNYSKKETKSNSLPLISTHTDLNPFRSYPLQEEIDRDSLEFWDKLHLDSKIILMKDGLYPNHLKRLIEKGIFSESDIRKIIINNISNSTSQKLKEYLGIQEFLKIFLQIESIKNFIIAELNGKNFDQFIQTVLGVDYIEWLLNYGKNIDVLKKEIITLIESPDFLELMKAKDYQTILSLKMKPILIEMIEKFFQDYKSKK